jgi:hypothetical protein
LSNDRKEVGVSSDGLIWRAIDKGSFDGRLSYLQAELDDGYIIEFGLQQNEDGILECHSFFLYWPEAKVLPPNAITSRTFQLLGFGRLLGSARKAYAEWSLIVNEAYEDMKVEQLLKEWTALGPIQIPDIQYAALASMYERFVLTGIGQPIAELSKFMGSDRATTSTRVAEARNRGLLSKPKHGTFGGQLTAKGKKLLGIAEKQETKGKNK